jgi:Tfp pilus assembly PilM family ATPase
VFDYDIWREPVGSKGGYEVVVSAFPEPAAAAYLELFSNTGLRPLAFETEAQALARALASRSDTPILLIDFGRLHVGLVVAAKGLALRASTITEISGETLSRALQKGLGVDEAAAEELKRKHGLHEGEDNRLVFSLLPALSVLREEVVKFIGAWQVARVEGESPRPPLGRVVLVGSEALLPGLVEYLAEGIALPVQIARVWQEILDEEVTIPPYPRAEALGFATALGLALRPYLRHE